MRRRGRAFGGGHIALFLEMKEGEEKRGTNPWKEDKVKQENERGGLRRCRCGGRARSCHVAHAVELEVRKRGKGGGG